MGFDYGAAMGSFAELMGPALQAYIEQNRETARQQKLFDAEEKKQKERRFFELIKSEAEAGNFEAVDPAADKFSPEVAEMLRSTARRAAEDNELFEAVMSSMAGIGQPQQPGAAPVPPPGGMEVRGVKVGPGRKPVVDIGPPTAEKQKFRGREIYRQAQKKLERYYVDELGMDPQRALAQASFQARHVPGAIVTDFGKEQAKLATFPKEGEGGPPSGLSSEGMKKFTGAVAARAAEKAMDRDLARPDREAFNNIGTSLKAMDRLRRLYAKIESKAGPARGRYTSVKDWAGAESPEVREFIQARRAVRDTLRRQVTGAAASFQELGRIEERIPNITDSPENFEAGLSASVNEINDQLDVITKGLKAQRFLVPGELTEVPEGLKAYLDETEVDPDQVPKTTSSDRKWAEEFVRRLKEGK